MVELKSSLNNLGRPSRPTRGKMRNVDRAYLAGFVDGEGSMGLYLSTGYKGEKYFYSRVMIGNTDLEIPKFMKQWYGGSLNEEEPQKGLRIYRWYACGKICDHVLRDIVPYLLQKKERAQMLLAYFQKRKMLSWEEKEKIRQSISALNGLSGKSHHPQRLSEKTP